MTQLGKEEPLNVDVPLEDQTKESLIAYIKSLEKQAEHDERERELIEKVISSAKDVSVMALDKSKESILAWGRCREDVIILLKFRGKLDTFASAPQEKEGSK